MTQYDFADMSEWAEEVEIAWRLYKRSAWRIGDLVNWGIDTYGNGSKDTIADLLGLLSEQLEVAVKTLTNYARIARAFPEERRVEALEIGHHELVIKRSPDEQQHWLRLAAENGWSVKRLRVELAAGGDGEEPSPLTNWVAIEREFYRAGIKASLGSKRIQFQTGASTLVLESESEFKWGVI